MDTSLARLRLALLEALVIHPLLAFGSLYTAILWKSSPSMLFPPLPPWAAAAARPQWVPYPNPGQPSGGFEGEIGGFFPGGPAVRAKRAGMNVGLVNLRAKRVKGLASIIG